MKTESFLFGWCSRGEHEKCKGKSEVDSESRRGKKKIEFDIEFLCTCECHSL